MRLSIKSKRRSNVFDVAARERFSLTCGCNTKAREGKTFARCDIKNFSPRLFAGSCQTVAHSRASRVVNSFSKMRTFFYSLAFAAALALAAPVGAQTAQANSTIEAAKIERTPTGGNAKNLVIRDPQLDFEADSASYDGKELTDFNSVTELRARGNVKVRLAPKPKTSAEKPFQIQSKSDEATLTFATRTLILKGNVSGFYRVANGPLTLLSGETAKFNYALQGVYALIEGAPGKQVELLLPAEATNKPDPLGPIKVQSDSLRIDEANNAAYFKGNARVATERGANNLDVVAPSFTLTRAGDGTIGTLVANGKTLTKLNVAPDPGTPATSKAISYVEVTADKVTVNRASSTGVFEGNVKGFYRLQNSPQKYDLSGERIVVSYDAKAAKNGDGLSVDANGTPFRIRVPGFDLGL